MTNISQAYIFLFPDFADLIVTIQNYWKTQLSVASYAHTTKTLGQQICQRHSSEFQHIYER